MGGVQKEHGLEQSADSARKKDIDHAALIDVGKQLERKAQEAPRAQQNQARDLLQKLEGLNAVIAAALPNDKLAERRRDAENRQEKSVKELSRELANSQSEHLTARFQLVGELNNELQGEIRRLLDRQQQEGQQATKLTQEERSKMQDAHQRQREDAAHLVAETKKKLLDLEARDENRMQQPRDDVKSELKEPTDRVRTAGQRADDMRSAIQTAISNESRGRKELTADVNALRDYVERSFMNISQRADRQALDPAREALGDLAKNISSDALQRVLREGALHPQKTRESGIKGQLFEEVLRAREEQAAKTESDKRIQFIAGDRIRDENNQKITDGILAWQDQNERWHIVKVFEAKAGEYAAKGLTERLEKMTKKFLEETVRYALDLAEKEISPENYENPAVNPSRPGLEKMRTLCREYFVALASKTRVKDLTYDVMTEMLSKALERAENDVQTRSSEVARMKELTAEHFKRLSSDEAQTELGQLERTVERLHENIDAETNGAKNENADAGTKLYIDGEAVWLARNQGRADVIGVVPKDVGNVSNADRLDVSEKVLAKIARALAVLFDEKRRN